MPHMRCYQWLSPDARCGRGDRPTVVIDSGSHFWFFHFNKFYVSTFGPNAKVGGCERAPSLSRLHGQAGGTHSSERSLPIPAAPLMCTRTRRTRAAHSAMGTASDSCSSSCMSCSACMKPANRLLRSSSALATCSLSCSSVAISSLSRPISACVSPREG